MPEHEKQLTLFCAGLLAFGTLTEGVYLHTRPDGRLFSLTWAWPGWRHKRRNVGHALCGWCRQDFPYCTITRLPQTDSPWHTKTLDWPSAWKRLSCSVKTSIPHPSSPSRILNWRPSVSLHTWNRPSASTCPSINKRIGKATTILGRPTTHVWENPKLTTPTKMAVYIAASSTLFCMMVKHEQHTPSRCANSIASTHTTFAASVGKTRCPVPRYLNVLASPTMFRLLRQRRWR